MTISVVLLMVSYNNCGSRMESLHKYTFHVSEIFAIESLNCFIQIAHV